ncbi:CHAP domain-containing protein [Entomobacter blattae]|uniref:CHAP domain protein n=1 Tax=Entomobacter blattae TaxID=2762277 RepID=A0A7H1NQA1_9PROT|nr:CHAP domain-containing protein [Entomobacter blattae]QNT77961.1 CHAP domain protein [Entomobacter blattae]
MTSRKIRTKFFSSLLTVFCVLYSTHSSARSHHGRHFHVRYSHNHSHRAYGGRVIQCVAFAKNASEVSLRGNAVDWWENAAGRYDRGNTPEAGSVLNFRSTRRMPLGHVAVVTEVLNSRVIVIDQSHWNQRGISRDTRVVDVSPNNDWSAVRVAIGHSEKFGSIYPTYGFIYPRAPGASRGGIITARNTTTPSHYHYARHSISGPLSQPMLSTEVAEAPAVLSPSVPLDAPNRNLR